MHTNPHTVFSSMPCKTCEDTLSKQLIRNVSGMKLTFLIFPFANSVCVHFCLKSELEELTSCVIWLYATSSLLSQPKKHCIWSLSKCLLFDPDCQIMLPFPRPSAIYEMRKDKARSCPATAFDPGTALWLHAWSIIADGSWESTEGRFSQSINQQFL